jgi:hypothetical protein
MVLRTFYISNFVLIPSAGEDITAPTLPMGPNDDESSVKKLEFLLGKS